MWKGAQISRALLHLEAMMMVVADMVPENVGTCHFHCHVNDHIEGGMQACYCHTIDAVLISSVFSAWLQ